MPKLDEGSILITSRKLPGIALTESIKVSKEIASTIRSFPEVTGVVTKLGRPDVATEAMGIYESDSYLRLAPRNEWRCCRDKQELIEKLSQALEKIPGVTYTFTQPMEMRLDETVTGIRGDVAIKIFGDDLRDAGGVGQADAGAGIVDPRRRRLADGGDVRRSRAPGGRKSTRAWPAMD